MLRNSQIRKQNIIRKINRKENMKRKPGDLQFQFASSSCAQPKEWSKHVTIPISRLKWLGHFIWQKRWLTVDSGAVWKITNGTEEMNIFSLFSVDSTSHNIRREQGISHEIFQWVDENKAKWSIFSSKQRQAVKLVNTRYHRYQILHVFKEKWIN